jgi:hypothetical protein
VYIREAEVSQARISDRPKYQCSAKDAVVRPVAQEYGA